MKKLSRSIVDHSSRRTSNEPTGGKTPHKQLATDTAQSAHATGGVNASLYRVCALLFVILPRNLVVLLAVIFLAGIFSLLFPLAYRNDDFLDTYAPSELTSKPPPIAPFAKQIDLLLETKVKVKFRRSCPCCGWYGTEFAPHKKSSDRRCPVCKSFERHRRACLVLGAGKIRGNDKVKQSRPWMHAADERKEDGLPFRLAHFGPQRHMESTLNRFPELDQVSLDYLLAEYQSGYSSHVMHADVTSIPLPNNFADGVVIFHVLEHITDLKKAMEELKRILYKNVGWLLVEVPCRDNKISGHKDCSKEITKEKRIKCSGQWDHVWVLDCNFFEQQLAEHGMDCYELDGSSPDDFGRAAPLVPSAKFVRMPLFACRAK